MVNSIRLAGTLAGSSNGPLPFAHLQIVTDENLEIEVSGSDAAGNWEYNIEGAHVVPSDPDNYNESSPIDLGGRLADNVWQFILQIVQQFQSVDIAYYPTEQNSNSFINSLLKCIGIDLQPYAPQALPENTIGSASVFGFPASGVDVRDQITFKVAGTSGADWFYSGAKNDVIGGSAGADQLDGGAGADIILTGSVGGSGVFETNAQAEKVTGGSETDYIIISAGSGERVEVEGGDTGDRLVIYKEMLGATLSTDGKHAMLALMGGVYGVISSFDAWSAPSSQHDPDANVNTNQDTDEDYRSYYFVDQHYSRSGGVDIVTDMGVIIEYRHYVQDHRLEILISKPSEEEGAAATLLSTIVINDYQSGDYGISLKGPLFLADIIFDDVSTTDDYHALPGIGTFNEAVDELIEQSNGYRLEVDPNAPADEVLSSLTLSLNGDAAANRLIGNDVNEKFLGDDGNDRIFGNGGDDDISGGNGNDTMEGGLGSDIINGGEGTDTADYTSSLLGVIVNLLAGTAAGGDAQGDLLSSIEYLIGSALADQLFGNDAINRLTGGMGDDVLNGAGGNDILIGGDGADSFIGGAGDRDAVDYREALQAVGVNLLLGGFLGEAFGDTFTGMEYVYGSAFNDQIIGDALVNRLIGGLGSDMLSAGGGNDYVIGGLGSDMLTGGLGHDVFLFEEGAFDTDTISDFAAGTGRTDRIWLTQQGVTNFLELSSHFEQAATGVDIQLTNGVIHLAGLSVAQLVADDFIFS